MQVLCEDLVPNLITTAKRAAEAFAQRPQYATDPISGQNTGFCSVFLQSVIAFVQDSFEMLERYPQLSNVPPYQRFNNPNMVQHYSNLKQKYAICVAEQAAASDYVLSDRRLFLTEVGNVIGRNQLASAKYVADTVVSAIKENAASTIPSFSPNQDPFGSTEDGESSGTSVAEPSPSTVFSSFQNQLSSLDEMVKEIFIMKRDSLTSGDRRTYYIRHQLYSAVEKECVRREVPILEATLCAVAKEFQEFVTRLGGTWNDVRVSMTKKHANRTMFDETSFMEIIEDRKRKADEYNKMRRKKQRTTD